MIVIGSQIRQIKRLRILLSFLIFTSLFYYYFLNRELKPLVVEELLHRGSFRLKDREKYSSVFCRHVADRGPVFSSIPWLQVPWQNSGAQCLFNNIALTHKGLVYYKSPEDDLDFISSRASGEFPEGIFLEIKGAASPGRNPTNIAIIVVEKSIPDDAVYADTDLTVFLDPFWPENIGHFMIDDVFAAFSLLFDFGLPFDPLHLTVTVDCEGKYVKDSKYYKNCLRSYGTKTEGLGANPLYLSETNPYDRQSKEWRLSNIAHKNFHNGNGIFFKNLAEGIGPYGLVKNRQETSLPWKLFRDMYMKHMKIIEQPLVEHHITIINKKGRRSMTSFDQVVDIAKSFGVKVTVFDVKNFTWAQELELLSKTSVFFSVPGGTSFVTGFLQEKSAAVILDIWDNDRNTSSSFEAFWWERISAYDSLNYVLDIDEIEFPEAAYDPSKLTNEMRELIGPNEGDELHPSQQTTLILHHIRYKLKEEKVRLMFCRALSHAENLNGWVNSFDRSNCNP